MSQRYSSTWVFISFLPWSTSLRRLFPQPKCFMLKSPMFHIESIPHMENMVCPINEFFQHYRLRCSGLMILCDIMWLIYGIFEQIPVRIMSNIPYSTPGWLYMNDFSFAQSFPGNHTRLEWPWGPGMDAVDVKSGRSPCLPNTNSHIYIYNPHYFFHRINYQVMVAQRHIL